MIVEFGLQRLAIRKPLSRGAELWFSGNFQVIGSHVTAEALRRGFIETATRSENRGAPRRAAAGIAAELVGSQGSLWGADQGTRMDRGTRICAVVLGWRYGSVKSSSSWNDFLLISGSHIHHGFGEPRVIWGTDIFLSCWILETFWSIQR